MSTALRRVRPRESSNARSNCARKRPATQRRDTHDGFSCPTIRGERETCRIIITNIFLPGERRWRLLFRTPAMTAYHNTYITSSFIRVYARTVLLYTRDTPNSKKYRRIAAETVFFPGGNAEGTRNNSREFFSARHRIKSTVYTHTRPRASGN